MAKKKIPQAKQWVETQFASSLTSNSTISSRKVNKTPTHASKGNSMNRISSRIPAPANQLDLNLVTGKQQTKNKWVKV